MLTLYKNIRALRKQNEMTQLELAEKTGYTRSMIAKIEAGEVDLSRSKIFEFARVFGVSAADLMGDDGTEDDTRAYEELLNAYINKERQEKANALYDQYESLPPEKQAQFDNFLKFLQSDSELPHLH